MTLAVAVVVASVGVWQWRSPAAFREQGRNEVGIANPVGTPALVGVASPRREMAPAVLTVRSVEPRITEDDARVDVVVCQTGPGTEGIGAARGSLDGHCVPQQEAEGARLRRDDQVILLVRSEEPGRVVIEGVEVTYSHGWRRGSQVTGPTVTVDFGAETAAE